VEYVTNERGERTRVLLEIAEYERMREALEELEDIRESEDVLSRLESGEEERIPWEESKRRRIHG
jgi:PHD/YefM family antitoxin component YafN of YafNO toxin-antitoxin module